MYPRNLNEFPWHLFRLYIKCFVLNTNFDYSLVDDLTIRPHVQINLHVQLTDGRFEFLQDVLIIIHSLPAPQLLNDWECCQTVKSTLAHVVRAILSTFDIVGGSVPQSQEYPFCMKTQYVSNKTNGIHKNTFAKVQLQLVAS